MASSPGKLSVQASTGESWSEKRRIARGWFEVFRLAERERRKRDGEPLLQLVGDQKKRAA